MISSAIAEGTRPAAELHANDQEEVRPPVEESDRQSAELALDALQLLLTGIADFRLLEPEEQFDLARRYERGDLEAKERMVQSHLRLAISVAKQYRDQGVPFLDLIQEAVIGLNRAVEKYDWRKGCLLSTSAVWHIRDALLRALADQARAVRLPQRLLAKQRRLASAESRLTAALGRPPSVEELAYVLDMSETDVVNVMLATQPVTSLDAPVGETGTCVGDLVEDLSPRSEVTAAQSMGTQALQVALAGLPPRERHVLELHYGLNPRGPLNFAEIGRELGLTRERIRQLESEAFRVLRESPEAVLMSGAIAD